MAGLISLFYFVRRLCKHLFCTDIEGCCLARFPARLCTCGVVVLSVLLLQVSVCCTSTASLLFHVVFDVSNLFVRMCIVANIPVARFR